jgi:hypothetical protein
VADYVTALAEALDGHYSVRDDFKSPVESTRGFKARVRALEQAYGSKAAAARATGIDPTTWSRWKTKNQTPARASLGKVATAHLALLRAAKVARKGYPRKISIQATVACTTVVPGKKKKSLRYNGGDPNKSYAYRWFNADRLTGPQIQDVVNAWAAGRSNGYVADLLVDRITSAYGARFAFEGNNVNVNVHQ